MPPDLQQEPLAPKISVFYLFGVTGFESTKSSMKADLCESRFTHFSSGTGTYTAVLGVRYSWTGGAVRPRPIGRRGTGKGGSR